jgi:hypothetical protein
VSVVGDSVAAGDAVYELPGAGFVTARYAPVGTYLAAQLQQRGSDVRVLNRFAAAVGISSAGHPPYSGTLEYGLLLQDGCQYTLILPWVNDLTGGNPTDHATALRGLAQAVLAQNSGGRVIVVNYYQGAPAPFAASTFASGFTPGNVAAFNAAMAALCGSQIRCADAGAAFVGMGTSYLLGPASQQDLLGALVAPLSPDHGGLVTLYFSQNPGGLMTGDGVHLSAAGKSALAAYLAQFIR